MGEDRTEELLLGPEAQGRFHSVASQSEMGEWVLFLVVNDPGEQQLETQYGAWEAWAGLLAYATSEAYEWESLQSSVRVSRSVHSMQSQAWILEAQ